MKPFAAFGMAVLLSVAVVGCEPTERTHARILGGQLKYLYQEWSKQGGPTVFEPTNYIYNVSSTYGTKYQFFVFTNTVNVKPDVFHCRFAVRDPTRFYKPGVVAITDEGVLLWIGDDGKIIVAPDTKDWSSK